MRTRFKSATFMDFTMEFLYANEKLFLRIKTSFDASKEEAPTTIDLLVYISKIIGEDKYPIDTLILNYHVKSKEFMLLSNRLLIEADLYKKILERLGETYEDQWGITME